MKNNVLLILKKVVLAYRFCFIMINETNNWNVIMKLLAKFLFMVKEMVLDFSIKPCDSGDRICIFCDMIASATFVAFVEKMVF